MRIDNIQSSHIIQDNIKEINTKPSFNSFESFFDEAVNLFKATNQIQSEVTNKQIDFITGKSDDVIALNMAQARASSAIQFTSQITNKILNVYQEIMRIPI